MTLARAETDAMMVPVSEYADIVDSRPRVVGHAGGVTNTVQLILLLRAETADEKFKNIELPLIEVVIEPPIST
jgi:hypothetical protein